VKIDSHQHFWKYTEPEFGWINDDMKILRRDFFPADLHKDMQSFGIDGSIAVQARQSLEETRWLLELAERNQFIKGVVGWIDLRSPDVEQQLALFLKNKKFVGTRHIVQAEPDDYFLLRPDFMNGIKALQHHNLAYDILIYPKHIPAALKFVSLFPDMRFVLDHMAKPNIKKTAILPWKDEIKELSKYQNLFCKVSGMVTEADIFNWKNEDFYPYLDVIFELFGTKRVMIGSDWPVCIVAGSYDSVLSIVMEYIKGFSEEEKEGILGGNAVRAYGLQ
jgi:L-fuconolactonase